MKPHRATTVLVLGILSLVTCYPLGIVAWVLGNNDLREMNNGLMDPSGRDSTNAGRICGIIGTVLTILMVLLMIVWFAFVGLTIFAASKQTQNKPPIEMAPTPER
jgi:hypothetical protein